MTLHYSTENSYHYGKHQHFLYNPSSNKPAALAAYLNITIHLKSIYEEGELDPVATCKDYLQVHQEGGRQWRHPKR